MCIRDKKTNKFEIGLISFIKFSKGIFHINNLRLQFQLGSTIFHLAYCVVITEWGLRFKNGRMALI